MQDPKLKEIFDSYNAYMDKEQELREKIRESVRGKYFIDLSRANF